MTVTCDLLSEDGEPLLLEDGEPLLLEHCTTIVPNIIGLSPTAAAEVLTLAGGGLVLGEQSSQYNSDVPAGLIYYQAPAGGSVVEANSAVNIIVSLGPALSVVPDLYGLTPATANSTVVSAGFRVGDVGYASDSQAPLGVVIAQSLAAGTRVPAGTRLSYTINVFIVPFDVETTVISQYANSPTIMEIVRDMAEWLDPRANLAAFYTFVWNVDTAQGFGLDVWGRIVGVSRLLKLGVNSSYFGYENASVPADWKPFNNAVFNSGASNAQAYLLPDDAYRTLILTKALANIVATNAASLNQLLRNLFPGRGRCYVNDLGGMAMQFVFEFQLTPSEYAILTQSGVLPHPAGVSYSVLIIDTAALFGFAEQGADVRPFDDGVFYQSP